MLSIDDFVQVAQANHLPLIVDAAAGRGFARLRRAAQIWLSIAARKP
ncbi:hypothetical protein KCP77_02210 [Salmonella enterica subsp. enterica]|nr:hypothetical protein KCP77_02210 [Salmonella enterica subsp. enterica]